MLRQVWFVVDKYLLAVVSVLIASMLGNELHGYATLLADGATWDGNWGYVLRHAAYCLLLTASLIVLLVLWHRRLSDLFLTQTRRLQRRLASESPRSHLVLFLSAVRPGANSTPDGPPSGVELTGDLDLDLAQMLDSETRWPWEQMLRAIRAHLPKLRAVYVICSRESVVQAEWFHQIVNRYGALAGVKLWIVTGADATLVSKITGPTSAPQAAYDFEDFDVLSSVMRRLLRRLRDDHGVDDGEVMIDFTGGQKVTSVVAMTASYGSDVGAQYVQTGKPKDVYAYDIVLTQSPSDVPVKM